MSYVSKSSVSATKCCKDCDKVSTSSKDTWDRTSTLKLQCCALEKQLTQEIMPAIQSLRCPSTGAHLRTIIDRRRL